MNQETRELLTKYKQKIFNVPNKYYREIFEELKNVMENHSIILIGLRQVGKTTLMEQLAKLYYEKYLKIAQNNEEISTISSWEDIFYINLKALYQIERVELLNLISQNKYKLILIDEIQLIPRWSDFLQSAIDLNSQARFIVSGSNTTSLKSETMVNRIKVFFVHPLSFIEFKALWKNEDIDDIDLFLQYGSYPKSAQYNNPIIQYRELVESSIIDKIITNDISTNVDAAKFKTLMKDINNYVGNKIVISKLENKKITRQTAKSYISLMKNAQLIHLVPKYQNKNNKVYEKIYFEDKSMIYFLNNFEKLDDNTFDALVENVVFAYIIKKYANQLKLPNVFYYQGENKKEIDFLIENKKILIECKYRKNIDIKLLINELNETIGDKFKDYRKIVITKNTNQILENWEFISLENILRGKDGL